MKKYAELTLMDVLDDSNDEESEMPKAFQEFSERKLQNKIKKYIFESCT